jgi:hypothetical protein
MAKLSLSFSAVWIGLSQPVVAGVFHQSSDNGERRAATVKNIAWYGSSIRAAGWVASFSCSRGRVSESLRTPE